MGIFILVNYIIIECVLASAHLRRDFGKSMKGSLSGFEGYVSLPFRYYVAFTLSKM